VGVAEMKKLCQVIQQNGCTTRIPSCGGLGVGVAGYVLQTGSFKKSFS
jgi:hypothetical protein